VPEYPFIFNTDISSPSEYEDFQKAMYGRVEPGTGKFGWVYDLITMFFGGDRKLCAVLEVGLTTT